MATEVSVTFTRDDGTVDTNRFSDEVARELIRLLNNRIDEIDHQPGLISGNRPGLAAERRRLVEALICLDAL